MKLKAFVEPGVPEGRAIASANGGSLQSMSLRFYPPVAALAGRVRAHLSDPHASHRHILTGFLWVSFFVLIGKFAGAAKEMAIAWRYGVSETVDAYIFVFNLVSWPVSIWFSVISAVLIPLLTRLRREDESGLRLFRAELYGTTALLGLALAAGIGALLSWSPFLTRASGLAPGAARTALDMVWPLTLSIPLALPVTLLATETMARQRHGNTLLEGAPALILCLAVLLMGAWPVAALSWGTFAGFFAQFGMMLWYLSRFDTVPRLRFGFSAQAWQAFRAAMATMVVAQILQSLTGLVDPFWAARLGEGAISAMGYANRILSLILGLGATAIGRAMLPVLSAQEHEDAALRYGLARQWALWLFVLGVACAAVFWIAALWLVGLLFERGAFGAEDTTHVAEFLRWGLLQLPFYFAGMVWVSLLTATRAYSALFFGVLGNLFIKFAMNETASGMFGADGLYLATALMYCFSMCFLWFMSRRALASRTLAR